MKRSGRSQQRRAEFRKQRVSAGKAIKAPSLQEKIDEAAYMTPETIEYLMRLSRRLRAQKQRAYDGRE